MPTPERTITGFCERGICSSCSGQMSTGTGWNWWCTHGCHPEPVITDPAHRPALDFWRRHRAIIDELGGDPR
jgi:hypothetical protein